MSTVTVASKLPSDFDLVVGGKTVTINGYNKAIIHGSKEAYTEVDKSFWDAWVAENKNRSWYTSLSIFAEESAKSVKAKAKELKDVKTGLEAVIPSEKAE